MKTVLFDWLGLREAERSRGLCLGECLIITGMVA